MGEAILYLLPVALAVLAAVLNTVHRHQERRAGEAALNHLTDEELDARAAQLEATFHRVAGKKYTTEAERRRALEAARELQEVGERRFCR